MKKIVLLGVISAIVGWDRSLLAASQAKLHVAVYSAGFVVETERTVAYGQGSRRVEVRSHAKGTAEGEVSDPSIIIDQLSSGTRLRLDPKTKTYFTEKLDMKPSADAASPGRSGAPSIVISNISSKVSGPLGTDTIQGHKSKSYSVRVMIDFSTSTTGRPIATEMLLEKLWVTAEAPAIEKFRKEEAIFDAAFQAKYDAQEATLRWLIREFNRQVLSFGGRPEDLEKMIATYRSARAEVPGVTVRQVVAWTWQPKDATAPGSGLDAPQFIASLAAGLGAPPDTEGKKPLPESLRPYWAQEMEKDFGRSGSTVVMLGEVLKASGQAGPELFEAPMGYRKMVP